MIHQTIIRVITYFKVIRSLLLKIVNSSMENINKILDKNNWNLTRSPDDGHCTFHIDIGTYSAVGHTIFIIDN